MKSVGGYDVRASFATYKNGILWIGQFDEKNETYEYGYSTSGSEKSNFKLTAKYRIKIPSKIQGITFDKNGRLILSQSYGRNSDSKICVYDKLKYTKKGNVYYATASNIKETIKAPPTSQNMFVGSDNLLYILFESAADFYLNNRDNKGKADKPVDRVCPIKI